MGARHRDPGAAHKFLYGNKKLQKLSSTPANQLDQELSLQKRVIVAAIGASAGGIEALRNFFEALPPELDIAFVVIMHLSPEHRSELAALLGAYTTMPVTQVTESIALEPRQVYVIPPDRELVVTNSRLSTRPFEEPRGHRAPIDHFFRSLAHAHGDGFAIILSGGGSDGSAGLKDIKEQGGLILVQDPKEALFEAMPRSAIATGLADIVLPVAELAACLPGLTHSKQQFQALVGEGTQAHLRAGDEALLQQILAHIRARTGHNFSQYKRPTVLRRLGRRMQLNRKDRLGDYLVFLRENPAEAQALFSDFLISVTSFFRDPAAFEALQQSIIPKLIAEKTTDSPIRIWTAGCATGEEAYSLAILLLEAYEQCNMRPDFQIFASDLAEGALAIARDGRYATAIEMDVTPERLRRFFTKETTFYRVNREVRDVVLFATHSLLKDPPFSRLDLISCRNLLIYLDREIQEQVFAIFHSALLPGSYLFLGSSENAEGEYFHALDKKYRIFQAQARKREVPLHLPDLLLGPSTSQPRPSRVGSRIEQSAGALHSKLLEELAPPSILVDEQRNARHLSTTAGRYLLLPSGPFTNDITQLVRPELQAELRTALYRAFEREETTLSPLIAVQFNDTTHQVALLVQPQRRAKERQMLVMFIEGAEVKLPETITLPANTIDSAIVQKLQEELRHAQESTHAMHEEYEAANEKLRAANEELQSTNEEYHSTAEELETSKEELQSINEELHTVNSELKHKLDEISHAHSDLQNFMAATEGGTLFLDRALHINRFTPIVADLFNITPTDRGRSITDFTHRLDYANLEKDAQQVLDTLIPIERESQSTDGRRYLMRLRPYRTIDNRIDGVVLTLVDITERRQTAEALRESEARRLVAIEAAGVGDWTLDPQTDQFFWSERVCELFGVGPTAEGTLALTLAIIHPDDRAHAQAAMQSALVPAGSGRYAVEFRVVRPDGSVRWVDARGQALFTEEKGTRQAYRVIGAMLDVTEHHNSKTVLHKLELASTLIMAEQEARRQMAQVLHDDLQQLLYGIQMRMVSLIQNVATDERTILKESSQEMSRWLGDAIRITRQLTVDLSPPILKNDGLVDALSWLATQMEEINGLHVELQAEQTFPIANEDMRVLLFQIVRELLFNVVKHSGTDRATVALHAAATGQLIIRVTDHGQGFDMAAAETKHKGGYGLFSVRSRLAIFGGHIEIASGMGQGTQVTVYAPPTA